MSEAIKKRRSIRKYQKKEIEEEKIKEILKAATFAPSGHNRQPWEFIVIRDEETKQKLVESSQWASFAKDASVIIVVVGDEEKSWLWVEDCSLAAGNIYLEATNQGLGACWVQIRGGKTIYKKDAEKFVKKLLGIPSDRRVLCLMTLGYPTEEKREHHDSELDSSKIHEGTW